MIDFAKLYCDLHPHQIITNFCLKETCMIGLCATCICTHTEQHAQNHTTPEYQNIRATFSNMHDMIRKKITSLDGQKNRIEKITEFVHTKRKALKQNIEQTRQQAMEAVSRFFENKQKAMFREVESEEKKMGLHSEARMESLMNSLNRETSVLITSAQELNSQNFLESYQRIKTQTLHNAHKLEEQISRELDRNEDFETIINSNNEFIQGIYSVLEQSLQLTFTMNPRPLISKVQPPQSKVFKNQVPPPPPVVCHDKVTSRFGSLNFHNVDNLSQPVFAHRQINSMDNFYTGISFSHVPDAPKKDNGPIQITEQSEKQTTKSIVLHDTEKSIAQGQTNRKSKSFVKEVLQTQIMKEKPIPGQILKEKDQNQIFTPQSFSKAIANKNHQSQIIIEKPYQSLNGWSNPNRNSQSALNQSFIENLNQFTQDKSNSNTNSHVTIRNQSSNNLHHVPRPASGQKINFTPQMYEPAYFNQSKINENLNTSTDCKKMKKLGLSLMKSSFNVATSRSKLYAE